MVMSERPFQVLFKILRFVNLKKIQIELDGSFLSSIGCVILSSISRVEISQDN